MAIDIPGPSKPYRGFRHFHTEEELLKYAAISPEEKLRWLEEINEFMWKAMTPEAKEAARRFRSGEI